MGIPAAKNTRTIRNWNWYRIYWIHERTIVINYVPKINQPLFLTEFPDKAIAITQLQTTVAKTWKKCLMVNFISAYIHETILPEIVMDLYNVKDTDPLYEWETWDSFAICRNSGNWNIVISYLENLGFRYKPRQKTYYVDSHEHPEVQKFRQDLCDIPTWRKRSICIGWVQLLPVRSTIRLQKVFDDKIVFILWVYHVNHLTQHILKGNYFLHFFSLQLLHLNSIKGSHLHIIQTAISIHIQAGKPISFGYFISFIFLTQHEKDKVFIR